MRFLALPAVMPKTGDTAPFPLTTALDQSSERRVRRPNFPDFL